MMAPLVPTIFALSSAPGRAGVAVIRVSGPAAGAALDHIAPPRPAPRVAALRAFLDSATGETVDRGLALWFPAPASFTGEDAAEFHAHGGRAIVAALLSAIGSLPGCRLAEPGEFARRAFENGKIDLAEAEGLADLIDAETEAQRRHAMHQAGGALSKLYETWRRDLIAISALVEASIDFSDEGDVAADAMARAETEAAKLLAAIDRHLDDGHRGEILRDGFRVVIAGPPNAGKSSLMNALARRDVAIVSEEAGTTRDVIETRLDLDGWPVIISDTAGIREAAIAVEREGVRRAVERARDADLVLWLTEAFTRALDPPDVPAPSSGNVVLVRTKVDLLDAGTRSGRLAEEPGRIGASGVWDSPPPTLPREGGGTLSSKSFAFPFSKDEDVRSRLLDIVPPPSRGRVGGRESQTLEVRTSRAQVDGASPPLSIAVSTKTGAGLDALIRLLAGKARARMDTGGEPAIGQIRHRAHLHAARQALEDFLAANANDSELRAEDLRRASSALGRIMGRIDPEEVLGQIFQRFCIGK